MKNLSRIIAILSYVAAVVVAVNLIINPASVGLIDVVTVLLVISVNITYFISNVMLVEGELLEVTPEVVNISNSTHKEV